MSNSTQKLLVLAALAALTLPAHAVPVRGATPTPSPASTPNNAKTSPVRPASASGTVVAPDHFLRRWDPITIFFGSATGPGGGPEDHPDRFVTLSPEQAGAWKWLDAKTLQFGPAEPWAPLARETVSVGGKNFALATLMSAPLETTPSAGQEGLDPVAEIRLTFAEPLDPESLARMTTLELRPLPGVGKSNARFLNKDDFSVKPLPRKDRGDSATYVLGLAHPIPFGTRCIVHLRLSLDDDSSESMVQIPFSTLEPFRVERVGCRNSYLPITPEGTRYTKDQAIRCEAGMQQVTLEFSSSPRQLGTVEGRNLVQFTPPVEGLDFSVHRRTLEINGRFSPETLYRISLSPIPLTDEKGRPMTMTGKSEAFVFFPRQSPYLQWNAAQGLVERLGPQMLPMEGRGQDRIDLRIFKVEALDRNFWPFPGSPVVIDESHRPPGPGEEPKEHDSPDPISSSELARHITVLGSPPVSSIVKLPLRREGSAAGFGLDLKSHLAKISGESKPGTYLVGVRRLDGSNERSWVRVQVTDLSLSTLEETQAVRFQVTSLSSGEPVSSASIRVEGSSGSAWFPLWEGNTDSSGVVRWTAIQSNYTGNQVRRIVVTKGDDQLVLDPSHAPDAFSDNQWFPTRETWLQWTQNPTDTRPPAPETVAHLFTERPVYRPDEDVHIKGYLRVRHQGKLTLPLLEAGNVIVSGPGNLSWTYPTKLTGSASFYKKFHEKELPTGVYTAVFEDSENHRHGSVSWRMEAYRLPEFEIQLHGPDKTSLDKPFDVSMTASYYAGGRVSGRPVRWRVTQFPYTWTPEKREGFLYSSDGRFSNAGEFTSNGVVEKEGETDDQGAATISINPATEPTAHSRSYVVEATVVGADDQTVTSTRSVVALPAFVLGLKVPRFVEKVKKIEPEVLVVGPEGKPLAGQKVTVKLSNRQWHSHLTATDFSNGVAKYVTDVVDEKVSEITITSTEKPITVPLDLPRSGVYIVELESRDKLGRAQVISVDLFSAGDQPVSWSRPTSQVFSVATDKPTYDPGDTAAIILKSPFQKGAAIACIEAPEGNQYQWINVSGGTATLKVPLKGTWTPRIPVHFILMRGRVSGTAPVPGSDTDLGKPATMAATAWLTVNPLENQVDIAIDSPEKAQPGQTVTVKVSLTEPRSKKPLSGEVTLWLVDQAVLALGSEQRLDPLPDFITAVYSHFTVRDTRNLAFGFLPTAENPGGDEGENEKQGSLLDKTTVRKNFKTVPYYESELKVGPNGVATVSIKLPDNLTNFKIRAKAASGTDRFGAGTGMIQVRLPLIVQPALPRFVRPGDTFIASGIGRVVEGPGGAGQAEIRVDGVKADGATKQTLTWVPNKPTRIDLPVTVLDVGYDKDGKPARDEVTFTMGVGRTADGAKDAFEAKLPIRADREPVHRRILVDLKAGTPVELPDATEAPRAGTLKRTVLASDQPGLIRMAAGLDFLLQYPYGCTEQRTSKARAEIATKRFREMLHQTGDDTRLKKDVNDTLEWIPTTIDPAGLVAYWPGGHGYVSLTAWVVEFMVEAKEAGFNVDPKVFDQLTKTLEQALRSDYSRFIDGESWEERAMALQALARAGKFSASYGDELARKSNWLDLEGSANVLLAFAGAGQTSGATGDLQKKLTNGVVFRLYNGNELYGGLQFMRGAHNGLILPGETRTVAAITRSLYKSKSDNKRLQLLTDALVTLGRDDGWGSTNADAEALLALSEVLNSTRGGDAREVAIDLAGKPSKLTLGKQSPVGFMMIDQTGKMTATVNAGTAPIVLRAETTYMPAADGSQVSPESTGFVVTRETQKVIAGRGPKEKTAIDKAGTALSMTVGDVIEEHVQVVNPKERHYVAVVVPMAAGMEPLNPTLATAPPEAAPSGTITSAPSYAAYYDDQVAFFYDTLPNGTFDFYFRTRAQVAGSFIQPPAHAEMMYDGTVHGGSAGAKVTIVRAKEK